jgi:hypothetical protein
MSETEGNEHQDNPERDIQQPPASIERANSTVNDTTSGNDGQKKTTNWPQRIEAVCAILLVLITGAYTYYARKQLRAMQGQIAEMKNARAQSKIDNAAAIVAQQKIAQDSLKKSQENIAKSSQDAETTFRDEQRAWVGAIAVTDISIKEKELPSFHVVVINSGKTPALHLRFVVASRVWRKTDKANFGYEPIPKDQTISNFVLQPGAQYFLNSGKGKIFLSKDDIAAVVSGEIDVHIFGKMTYEDVSKRLHHTKFCFIVMPDLKAGEPCNTYNEAD